MAFLRRRPRGSAHDSEQLGAEVTPARPQGGPVFNVLAAMFIGLSGLICLCYAAYLVPGLPLPFVAVPPTATVIRLTSTPTWGLPTIWTPTVTGTPTETPTPFATSIPVVATTIHPTFTPTPTPTWTPSPGPPVSPSYTPSIYPFTAEVTYQPSPINTCGASYILGTIEDLAKQPMTARDLIIHVEGDGEIDAAFRPGEQVRGNKVDGPSPFTGTGFGPSAWNVVINLSGTSAGTWRVWLVQGGQASDIVEIRLEETCVRSSAVVRFQQNHLATPR